MGNRVDTLETMAMRCVLSNLEALEERSFEGVSEVWVQRIWGSIERR
jgi:hypothetical protein